MSKTLVTLKVNDATYEVAIKPQDTLALALRDGCGLTGTKVGCDMGTCGCCTVLVDGEPVLGCLTLALGRRELPLTPWWSELGRRHLPGSAP
jgi:aerobic-type carbon monoxide dehydrogenase small subunit (CoxS/CutS family)